MRRTCRLRRGASCRSAILLAGVLAAAPGGNARAQAGDFPVQRAVVVRPDTVTVGDPFLVAVRIRAPEGATIEFPEGPDSLSAVEALDPRTVRDGATGRDVDRTASYRVAAWDTGPQPVLLGDVIVRLRGAERRVSLAEAAVFVRSVLPAAADSGSVEPKPARELLIDAMPWWYYLLAAVLLAALIALGWWWWRRRRRRLAIVDTGPDAYEVAEREFARIEALGLVDAGERGRYVALMVEVLRDYLAARYRAAPTSLTTLELLLALRETNVVPGDRLRTVLEDADLIKFARRPASGAHARDLGRGARSIVADVETAERAAALAQADEQHKAAA
ncbi:MAG: DUF4381 family protein [Gemmatimonadaceae bacterium]